MTNDVFKAGDRWQSPRGLQYLVLEVETSGTDLPVATLVRKYGLALGAQEHKRWYNDNDGWTRIEPVRER